MSLNSMRKAFRNLFSISLLVSIPFLSAFGEEPVVRIAVADSQPAIREVSKGAISDISSAEAKKVRIIEIVSHAIESSNKTARQENEVSVKSEKPMPEPKDDVKAEEEADDESAEKADDDAEEETFDDGESGDIEKKVVTKNDELEEEPCDCGTLAEGECAPCDEDSNQ